MIQNPLWWCIEKKKSEVPSYTYKALWQLIIYYQWTFFTLDQNGRIYKQQVNTEGFYQMHSTNPVSEHDQVHQIHTDSNVSLKKTFSRGQFVKPPLDERKDHN